LHRTSLANRAAGDEPRRSFETALKLAEGLAYVDLADSPVPDHISQGT